MQQRHNSTFTLNQSHRHPSQAFTLIELVLVMVIVGVVSAIAVPRYASASARYQAQAAAKRIAHDMDLVRSFAYTSRQNVFVVFDDTNLKYTITPNPNTGDSNYIVTLSESPYNVTKMTTVFTGFKKFTTFNGYGASMRAGNIKVTVGNTLVDVYVYMKPVDTEVN